ncbi:hypothetical protein A1Q1_01250 [Trichosporon asahii var. asahii CBS 2479]|uniref:C2H2-type domain-containing protein n=1 Tax=Trichosporon asahii var. asahii (strain ATCC 90039 / CBS 2479 / JCM 2466 / KCTC 7840 / NBRC 103889/ NCYC 2677 / UAMH 7654) TaxID=1186058 RepID=J5T7R3_TRIAS|nr:hypothetical protein A1Q1_01250 [Trichosporon asahii var. asahii CBS 2479]EJT49621.1 hypothetical protein A1Q1_01250 [Trichosporon asahii var. asahii CBS 2479]
MDDHPSLGPFQCRTDGCNRIFDNWTQRNAHEARCCGVCPECGAHFQYQWLLDSHIHGHRTGYAWRCRLGCKESDRLTDQPGRRPKARQLPKNIDKDFLWFEKEHELNSHHAIDHGVTFAQARRAQGVPASYNGPVFVPLVTGSAAAVALEDAQARRRASHERTTANRGAAGKARDLTVRRLRRETERELETAAQREERQAKQRGYSAKFNAKRKGDTPSTTKHPKKKRVVSRRRNYDEHVDYKSDDEHVQEHEDELEKEFEECSETEEESCVQDESEEESEEELEEESRRSSTMSSTWSSTMSSTWSSTMSSTSS